MNPRNLPRAFQSWSLSVPRFSCIAAIYLAICCNKSFWTAVNGSIAFETKSFVFYVALAVILLCCCALLFNIVTVRYVGKPIAVLLILLAGISSYFMDTFGVRIDRSMLVNVMLTNWKEASDFFTASLFFHVFFFVLFPTLLTITVKIERRPFKRELLRRVFFGAGCLAIGCFCFCLQYKSIISFFRSHEEVRTLITPANCISAGLSLIKSQWQDKTITVQAIGLDAKQREHAGKPRIVVLVVGETARAKNWGLNGYMRQTTPVLKELDVVNFLDVRACGTSTAVSLPCMFSSFQRSEYTDRKGKEYENLVDVLNRAGVQVIWRDNDLGGAKGVANRVGEEKLYNAALEGVCNSGGCYDAILLKELNKKVAEAKPGKNIFLVLHQQGSHGPAYYLRYPKEFRRYGPECLSSDLQNCSQEEIVNTYDNTIAYTDYFLGQVAEAITAYSSDYDVAMLYVSDHGESLGEYGLYLHGLPYLIAPEEQIHIPMVVWIPEKSARGFGVKMPCLHKSASKSYSHDNVFHSVLGLMEVETQLYEKNKDIFAQCR